MSSLARATGRLHPRQPPVGLIPKNRVLAIGSRRPTTTGSGFHIPVGYLFAIGNPRSDWMFRTEPEAGLNGRSLAYPRGKVIGGCSAINAMISNARGRPADYDHWPPARACPAGRIPTCCRHFKRLEDHYLGESEHHGTGWRLADRSAAVVRGIFWTRSARPAQRDGNSKKFRISIPETMRASAISTSTRSAGRRLVFRARLSQACY